jgi:hypothetical protein
MILSPVGDSPMRSLLALSFAGLALSFAAAQEKADIPLNRFQVIYDPGNYPQTTPQEALGSIIKAIGRERYDYLVAHLLDPTFVDNRLRSDNITPDQLGKDVKAHLLEDPDLVKSLRRFLDEGEFSSGASQVTVRLKDVKDKQVYLKKVGTRWYMENRPQEEKTVEKEKE